MKLNARAGRPIDNKQNRAVAKAEHDKLNQLILLQIQHDVFGIHPDFYPT